MKKRPALLLIALLCVGTAGAQVYKWKDGKGVTHYSDQPPPTASTRVEVKSFSGGGGAVELPPELAGAARDRPVTLYTTGQCDGCVNARAMLMARGIPFREKTVNTAEDQADLQQAGGNNQLPFLLVGHSKLAGYEQSAWDALLTEAGYPADKILPASYRYPPAVAASPPPPPVDIAPVEAPPRQPPPPLNAPPGFQF